MSDVQTAPAPAAAEGTGAPSLPTPTTGQPAPTPVTVVQETKPTIQQTMTEVWDKLHPQDRVKRQDDGKFKSATDQATETQAVETETAPAEQSTDQSPTEAKIEPAIKPAIDPPLSWSADMKAKWASFSPDDQAFFAKRESEAHNQISELGRTVKSYEPIRNIIEQNREVFQQQGLHPADAFARMLAVNKMLENNAPSAIAEIAKAYGVDLSQLNGSTANADNPEGAQVSALKQEIGQLQRQLSQINNKFTDRENRETEAQKSTLAKSVEDFSKDKSYWSEIESDVYRQLVAINADESESLLMPAKKLELAHDRAIKLNEAVSNKLTEAKRKADADKKATEDKKKAEEAKRLASLNVKSSRGAAPQKAGRWEDTMRAVADKLMT